MIQITTLDTQGKEKLNAICHKFVFNLWHSFPLLSLCATRLLKFILIRSSTVCTHAAKHGCEQSHFVGKCKIFTGLVAMSRN